MANDNDAFYRAGRIDSTCANPSSLTWEQITGSADFDDEAFKHVEGGQIYIAQWNQQSQGIVQHYARSYNASSNQWSDVVGVGSGTAATMWGPHFYWVDVDKAVGVWRTYSSRYDPRIGARPVL